MSINEKADKSIEITNVGPIKQLSIPVPKDGGVVVLLGENGTGKTQAIDATEALYNKSTRQKLRNTDLTDSGSVEGLGVRVRFGRSNTVKGELCVESLDGRLDPSTLVDPGIKDPVKADSKRLATLIRLGNVQIDVGKWSLALGDIAAELNMLDIVESDDPVLSADRIRRQLHALAKSNEDMAKTKSSESAALAKSIADVDMVVESIAEVLAKKLDKASHKLTRLVTQRESEIQQEQTRSEAKEALTSLQKTAPNVPTLRESLGVAIDLNADCDAKLDLIAKMIDELNREIDKHQNDAVGVKNQKDQAVQLINRLTTEIHDATEVCDRMAALAAIVDRPIGVDDSIDEAIENAREDKAVALAQVEHGEVVRRAQMTARTSRDLAERAAALETDAERIRELARSTDSVLEAELQQSIGSQVQVSNGRLCVKSDRGMEPFSELSHGERWKFALDLAAASLPANSLLPVCQEAWESLDPSNRAHVNQLAKDRKLVILTAEATDGELRAEVVE